MWQPADYLDGMANGNVYVWVSDYLLKHNAAAALNGSTVDETDAQGMSILKEACTD